MKFYTNVCLHGNEIYHCGYDDGQKFIFVDNFEPTLSVVCSENTGWHSLYGDNVKEINFDSIKDFKNYKKSFGDSIELHGDISPVYQFLSKTYEEDILYNRSDIRIFLYDIETIDESGEFRGFPKAEDAPVEVVSVAIKDLKEDKYWLLSLRDWNEDKSKRNVTLTSKIQHCYFETETELLKAFCKLFEKKQPDMLVGYNNKSFDDPYMLHRIDKILGPHWLKKLSPLNKVNYEFKTNSQNQIYCQYSIKGLQVLDFLELYKKYVLGGRESYKLSFISQYELGDDKINYEEFDNIRNFYLANPQKFQDYNLNDVELVHKLDKKLGLIDLILTVAYMAKINYEDVISPIRTWDSMIYNFLEKANIVIPPNTAAKKQDFPGAYVHDPPKGIYKWVTSFDLNSLYPSLIISFNLSFETIMNEVNCSMRLTEIENEIDNGGDLEKLEDERQFLNFLQENNYRLDVHQEELDERFLNKKIKPQENYILAGSGYFFKKNGKGVFPKLMETLYNDRKAVKKHMIEEKKKENKNEDLIARLHNEQNAKKVLLNSFYGGLSNIYFRYFDIRLAKSITLSGQLVVKWKGILINEFLKEKFKLKKDPWLYSDTDSAYFCLDFIAEKMNKKPNIEIVDYVDAFCKKIIEPKIEEGYKDLTDYLNVTNNALKSEREVIAESFLITGKKRYCCTVWDDEGVRYKEPKLKVTGIEIVRSSTPKAIKPYMKEAIIILLDQPDKIKEFVSKVKTTFNKMTPEEISFPRSVSSVSKYIDNTSMYKKGTPIGVRASILYNNYIKEHDIDFDKIADGDKMKFFYAIKPNNFYNENVFGFINQIPNRESVVKYVDYSTQFNKVFFDVIQGICEKVGIQLDKVETTDLDSIF